MRTGEASRTEAKVILTEAQVILTSVECIENRLIKSNSPEIKRTSQHTYKYLKEASENVKETPKKHQEEP